MLAGSLGAGKWREAEYDEEGVDEEEAGPGPEVDSGGSDSDAGDSSPAAAAALLRVGVGVGVGSAGAGAAVGSGQRDSAGGHFDTARTHALVRRRGAAPSRDPAWAALRAQVGQARQQAQSLLSSLEQSRAQPTGAGAESAATVVLAAQLSRVLVAGGGGGGAAAPWGGGSQLGRTEAAAREALNVR